MTNLELKTILKLIDAHSDNVLVVDEGHRKQVRDSEVLKQDSIDLFGGESKEQQPGALADKLAKEIYDILESDEVKEMLSKLNSFKDKMSDLLDEYED